MVNTAVGAFDTLREASIAARDLRAAGHPANHAIAVAGSDQPAGDRRIIGGMVSHPRAS